MTRFAFAPWLLLAGLCVAADPADSVARVHRQDGGHGSGVVVRSEGGRSLVLTNRHVAPDSSHETDVMVGDHRYDAKWLRIDPDCDLAALEVKATLPVAKLADREPAKDAKVTLISHPDGWRRASKAGPYVGHDGMFAWNEMRFGGWKPGRKRDWFTVTEYVGGVPMPQVREFYQSEEKYVHAGFVSVRGDSGGPVFDADGRLVALVWGGTDGVRRANCVGLDSIKAFLAKGVK